MFYEGPRYNNVFDEMFDMNRDGRLDAGEANLEYEYIEESIREEHDDEDNYDKDDYDGDEDDGDGDGDNEWD